MYGYSNFYFSISMSKEQLLAVYSGSIRRVRVRTESGMVLDIDAEHLKNFTTMDGIHGRFKLTVDSRNRFVSLNKIG
ncbi:MAG: DUF2835 domain-containing protein [Succinivibrio sp.]|nr:DUF2835 domain-containing protein [Succinivibrio sp.]